MTTWEYKTLHRQRALDADGKSAWIGVKDWDPADLDAELAKLGKDGWELVAVTPRSSLGGWGLTGGEISRSYPASAGMTTSELFVFKRPKP